jgi:hypothetical protein
MGTHGAVGRCFSSSTAHPSSMAKRPLCRQTPEVGAECLRQARSDLCGGHVVTRAPTAIFRISLAWLLG